MGSAYAGDAQFQRANDGVGAISYVTCQLQVCHGPSLLETSTAERPRASHRLVGMDASGKCMVCGAGGSRISFGKLAKGPDCKHAALSEGHSWALAHASFVAA